MAQGGKWDLKRCLGRKVHSKPLACLPRHRSINRILATMQSDSGLLRWLKVPSLYNLFQEAVGAERGARRLIQNHVVPNLVIR